MSIFRSTQSDKKGASIEAPGTLDTREKSGKEKNTDHEESTQSSVPSSYALDQKIKSLKT